MSFPFFRSGCGASVDRGNRLCRPRSRSLLPHEASARCVTILPPERVADPERKRRFIQEAQSVSALNHPNIIAVHDITQEGGMDFMVMECVPGKTLGELIPINTPRTDVAEPPRTTVISPGKAVLTPLLAIEDLS
jgi:serine/threonine protein kinase